jgi:cytochrome c oxidase accessory protein FixG
MRSGKLAVLDEHGRRQKVHPAEVEGFWQRRVVSFRTLLVVVFVLAPLVRIGGHPLLLLEIGARRFWVFGHSFNAQDAPFAFLVLSGLGFALITMASTVGRVWCGWACPQTVWLEGVIRPIERLLEGSSVERKRLEKAPWGAAKGGRFVLKHALFFLVALTVAHWAVSLFVPTHELVQIWSGSPHAPKGVAPVIAFLTTLFYADFAWFREQTCLVLCPYGRLQGALQDRHTLLIGYDVRRGEPRGKAGAEGARDCVDCKRCIAVCPTGIDIRDGLQMECIGCTACIDACDDVMGKLGRPTGLIRYASEEALAGGTSRVVRPRTIGYAIAGVVGLVVVTIFVRRYEPFEANVLRAGGIPYAVDGETLRAPVAVHLVNKQAEPTTITLEVEAAPGATALQIPTPSVTLMPFEGRTVPVMISMPLAAWRPGTKVLVLARDALSQRERRLAIEVLGPHRAGK